MLWYDWLIIVIPVLFVLGMGLYTRRYLKDVTTYLSAGRVCGRYVISVADIANALSIIGLLGYIEIHYKTGFALAFWNSVILPIGVILGLFGYCTYRFRETKAQSIGQFLEMRYSRSFRIFAAALRSISEMLANMIMPALAARFFIYFLDLPEHFTFLGLQLPTFNMLMILILTLAISIICFGGSLGIIVTDTMQGFICYPLLAIFVGFILYKFSWNDQIVPVMVDRAPGESFLDPYDISKLRDFNLIMLFLTIMTTFLHRASWIGAGGTSTAARSPHEQKMASLLGTWRQAMGTIFYVLIAVALLTFLNHKDFSGDAHRIRLKLADKVATEVVHDPVLRSQVLTNIHGIPVQEHEIGKDAPLSDAANIDTLYLDSGREAFSAQGGEGKKMFQKFRTLYYQLLTPVTLRNMLPAGMLGLFCLLMVLAMISTDDSRIFSASITIGQDVILPLCKRQLSPREHMWMIRIVAILIGVFFFLGSSFMAQLDYIKLYVALVCTMWLGGCGPVMIFGLYSRFGTTKGAWTSLLTGMGMAIIGATVQRNWADVIYPWLDAQGQVAQLDHLLYDISKPFYPIIDWSMDDVKCPINSYEWYLFTMLVTLTLYVVVSLLTCKEPFNLERMLHRGKYALDEKREITSAWSWKNVYNKLIGITPEYSLGDKVIAWSYFSYSFIYKFGFAFVLVIVWNLFQKWPPEWWAHYFLVVFLIVPGIMAAITAVWFGIGGGIDLFKMFRDLEKRVSNPLDDGRVDGHMSLADKAELEAVDRKSNSK